MGENQKFKLWELVQQMLDDGWIVNLRKNALDEYDARALKKNEQGKYPSVCCDAPTPQEAYMRLAMKVKQIFRPGETIVPLDEDQDR